MMFEYPIRTRYSETAQDKIIHHSSYTIYLEEARIEFFNTLGCNINELEKTQIFCPVVDLSIKYLKPLRSLQNIIVQVQIKSHSKVRFQLGYTLLKDNVPIATAISTHCFLNALFKPIAIPKDFLHSLKKSN